MSQVTRRLEVVRADVRGMNEVVSVPGRAELVNYVHESLCRADQLDPAACPLVETPLTRRGRTVGAVFHVEGPRRIRPSAVWAAADDTLIFYDSAGTRVRTVVLSADS